MIREEVHNVGKLCEYVLKGFALMRLVKTRGTRDSQSQTTTMLSQSNSTITVTDPHSFKLVKFFLCFRYLRNNVLSTLASHGDEHAVNYSLTGFRIWMRNQRLLTKFPIL